MLGSNLNKDLTKAEMEKKVEAYRTLNSVLIQANAKYMEGLRNLLATKKLQQEELKVKLETGNGTEQENAEYLFIGGYVRCLEDITSTTSLGA